MDNGRMDGSGEILMPRLGVNDDSAIVTLWLVKNGEWVEKNQKVAVVETSKDTSEVKAEMEGIITCIVQEGDHVKVGVPIAVIGKSERPVAQEQTKSSIRMTEKARKIVEENGIDESLFPTDRLIKEKDVLALIGKPFSIAATKQNELLLYGAGGFSEIVIDILKVTHAYNSFGIIDMKYPDINSVMNVPVIANDSGLEEYYDKGYKRITNCVDFGAVTRKIVYEKLKAYNFEFPNIIHAKAILEPSVALGEGNLICAGAIIGAQAKIGNDCVINAGAIISHDCIISDHCHIASGAVLAGIVTVGENTLIGQNVTVYSRVKIGSNVVIENGCSVFKDIPCGTVVRNKL